MSEVKTRLIEEKDFGRIVSLANEWIPKDRDVRLKKLLDCMDDPNYHIMVIEVVGEIVGFLSFRIFQCWIRCITQLDIHAMYIQREWRNKGLGTKLCSAMLSSFDHDISFVSGNINWYKKLGYKLGEDKTWLRWNK